MPTYLHPGVYIEEVPSGVKTIEAVGTSTAAFIGFTTKGPLKEPRLIFNFDTYERLYGGIRDLGRDSPLGDAMGLSVQAFFQNGGTKAYIVRLAAGEPPGSLPQEDDLARATGNLDLPGPPAVLLEFEAVNEGSWANGLIVQVAPKFSGSDRYRVIVGRKDAQGKLQPLETHSDVSLDEDSPRYIEAALNGVSENVRVTVAAGTGVLSSPLEEEVELDGGVDGEPADVGDFEDVFTAFLKIRDVNTICLPDHRWDDDGQQFLESAIAHAEATRNRMVLVDPPFSKELVTEQEVVALTLPTSTYTVLYYPWVRVANPLLRRRGQPRRPRHPAGPALRLRRRHVVAHRRPPRRVEGAGRRRDASLLGVAGLRVRGRRRRAGPAQPARRQRPAQAARLRPGRSGARARSRPRPTPSGATCRCAAPPSSSSRASTTASSGRSSSPTTTGCGRRCAPTSTPS